MSNTAANTAAINNPTPNGSVSNPLTLLVPIVNKAVYGLRAQLQELQDQLSEGLNQLAIVHFVRLLFIPNTNLLAIITEYDGSFSDYIQAFVANPTVAKTFDTFLIYVDDVNTPPNLPAGTSLVPVQQNADAFVQFLEYYDATNADRRDTYAWYSAYPQLTVKQILKNAGGSSASTSSSSSSASTGGASATASA